MSIHIDYLFYFLFLRRQTVELVRRAEQCGVSWITVHGRTPRQRAEPASMDAIKLVNTIILTYKTSIIYTMS